MANSVCSFADFGIDDRGLYERYLNVCGAVAFTGAGVCDSFVGTKSRGRTSGRCYDECEVVEAADICVQGGNDASWARAEADSASGYVEAVGPLDGGEHVVEAEAESTSGGAYYHCKGGSCESRDAGGFGSTRRAVGVPSVLGFPRGPNYLRNQASRMRAKIKREEKKLASARGFRTEREQELHDLRVQRQIIQEKRKIEKLESPRQMIEDAMRQVTLAEKYAKMANDSKIARWAADLSSASAESIARSSGYSERVETVSTASSATREGSGGRRDVYNGNRGAGLRKSSGFLSKVSFDGNGLAYDYARAKSWADGYRFVVPHLKKGWPSARVALFCNISVDEVEKFKRLTTEFNISY